LDSAVVINAIDLSTLALLSTGLVTLDSRTLDSRTLAVILHAASSWKVSPDSSIHPVSRVLVLVLAQGTGYWIAREAKVSRRRFRGDSEDDNDQHDADCFRSGPTKYSE